MPLELAVHHIARCRPFSDYHAEQSQTLHMSNSLNPRKLIQFQVCKTKLVGATRPMSAGLQRVSEIAYGKSCGPGAQSVTVVRVTISLTRGQHSHCTVSLSALAERRYRPHLTNSCYTGQFLTRSTPLPTMCPNRIIR